MMVKNILEFIMPNLPITISIIALAVSSFVMYQNHLKPFKLLILTSHHVPWVNGEDFLCLDLSIDFFNSGMQVGLIDNIYLEISCGGDKLRLKQRHIRRFNDSQKLAIESFWNPFFLIGKAEINQIVSFYSEYNIDKLIDGEFPAVLFVSFKKKLNSKNNLLLKKDLIIILNKKEIIARSNRPSIRVI